MPNLTLSILPDTFSICHWGPDEHVPDWMDAHSFVSITRTADELSIVCLDQNVPAEVNANRGWRCLKVEGPLDLSLTGILTSLAVPLAEARIGIFAISTFDTDYVLVKEQALADAIVALEKAGHIVKR
ncbi:MAG TPA: ACT domain-containing protein [Anaerolineae bacterium]